MITSDSDEESPKPKLQQINIYSFIPKAKPVIQSNQKYQQQQQKYKLLKSLQINSNTSQRNLIRKIGREHQRGVKIFNDFQSANIIETGLDHKNSIVYLQLRKDTNSQHQSQWFYFRVKGLKKAKFIIQGFRKTDSLFNYGMKICVKEQDKWKRGGTNISYQQVSDKNYALIFNYQFSKPQNITEIAYCFPFVQTDFTSYLSNLKKSNKQFIKNQLITKTHLNNQINCLTFGRQFNKSIILIMCRVHPGETLTSFILNGILHYLLSSSESSLLLLKYYQIRIIPILNPDGVKVGNYRYSYTGRDLNRCWKYPSMKITPEIFYTKAYIEKIKKRICMVIDLHGHSRKKNVFFYGCQQNQNDKIVREFPYLMSKLSPYFNYQNCCFKVQREKEGTARVALWNMLNIPYVYTMQTSFCSKSIGQNFEIQDFEMIGKKLIEGICIFFSNNFKQESKSFEQKIKIKKLFEKQKNLKTDQVIESGSESQPSVGKLQDVQILQILEKEKSQKIQLKSLENANKFATLDLKVNDLNEKNTLTRIKRKNVNFIKSTKNITKLNSKSYEQKTQDLQRHLIKPLSFFEKPELNEKNNDISSSLKLKNFINGTDNRMLKTLSTTPKFQTIRTAKYKQYYQNGISNIVIDEQFLRTGNYGFEYLRLKNYAQRLMQEKLKLRPTKLQNQFSLQQKPEKKKVDAKFIIKPLKSQKNFNSTSREYNRFHNKYMKANE